MLATNARQRGATVTMMKADSERHGEKRRRDVTEAKLTNGKRKKAIRVGA